MTRTWLALLAVCTLAVACSSPGVDHTAHGPAADGGPPVLYDSLGSYSYRISTTSPVVAAPPCQRKIAHASKPMVSNMEITAWSSRSLSR